MRLALCLLLASLAVPAIATAATEMRVKPATVNVRSGPGTNHEVIHQLHAGDSVSERELREGWFRVRVTGTDLEGWIRYDMLERAEPLHETAPPAPVTDRDRRRRDAGGTLLFFSLVAIGLGAYFLPSIVANSREHHNSGSIPVINLFLGWTLLGWVIALAMAASTVKQPGSETSG